MFLRFAFPILLAGFSVTWLEIFGKKNQTNFHANFKRVSLPEILSYIIPYIALTHAYILSARYFYPAYCSICLPRKPAAQEVSFDSISPNFTFLSLLTIITEPMASPSQIIGLITWD